MIEQVLLASGLSAAFGLDRTAFMQLMFSRPIVAAPLTGLLFGDAQAGLLIGALLELLWLGRLPMGAAIPPDDTQIAVASTFMATAAANTIAEPGVMLTLLALFVAIPLGKIGIAFDHWARRRNAYLSTTALQSFAEEGLSKVERLHLRGLLHFALSSVFTFLSVTLLGSVIIFYLYPYVHESMLHMNHWFVLVIPLLGVANVLSNMNVHRTLTLFVSSFLMTYLLLWLV